METMNVNVRKVRFHSSRKVNHENGESGINIGDNLFSLMLISIAAVGIWAMSAVLLL